MCLGPNIPHQGRQGSRGCIPGSPGESGLVSRGNSLHLVGAQQMVLEMNTPHDSNLVSLGAYSGECRPEYPTQMFVKCPSPVSPWVQEEPGAQESPCWSSGTDLWAGRHQSPSSGTSGLSGSPALPRGVRHLEVFSMRMAAAASSCGLFWKP